MNLDFVIVLVTCYISATNVTNFRKNICIDIEKNRDCWDGGSIKLTNFLAVFIAFRLLAVKLLIGGDNLKYHTRYLITFMSHKV